MGPTRLEMRSTGQQHKHGSGGCLIEHQVQQFKGRWVCPVQVFQAKEDRLLLSQLQEDCHKRFQGPLSHALWGEIERRISMFRDRQREQRGKELDRVFDRKPVLAKFLCECRQFLLSGIVGLPWQDTLEKVNKGIECRILIVLRASTFPACMGFVCDMLFEHLDQTTLPNTWFAR